MRKGEDDLIQGYSGTESRVDRAGGETKVDLGASDEGRIGSGVEDKRIWKAAIRRLGTATDRITLRELSLENPSTQSKRS